ncbi:MAG: threonylcarbamoyl-AMP synthase [Opitutae bacterium]|nr:threonylcarbamoyl-AMP synthase [Opitutae bacterium]
MKTRVHSPTPVALRRLAAALRRGELVAIPTETVYGLAANALDARACRRIFTAKRRPANDPLIVHVTDLRAAEQLAKFNDVARALARAFWPGPLTLVLPKRACVPAIVTSGQNTVAVRAPAHPLARKILQLARVPLAAPSANPFGYVSPTTAAHVLDGLGGRIPHVLDGGACAVGVESTIVDMSDPARLVVLRPGAISAGDLHGALARARLGARIGKKAREQTLAPGLLDQHYSPHTPFTLVARAPRETTDADTGVIFWERPRSLAAAPSVFALTRSGDADDAARSLYAVLRAADAAGFARLVCEKAPARAGALGEAINDRLRRAAGKRRGAH